MKAPVATSASVDSELILAPFSALLDSLDKKREYLNKRIEKLNKLNDDARNGMVLTEIQEDARKKLPEVEAQVDHLKRLSKQVKDHQRDYNRQKKQRDAAQITRLDEVRATTVVDALTARHVCEEYLRPEGQLRYANSFTEEERARLYRVASIFVPKIESLGELRQEIGKSAVVVTAILQKDSTFSVCNGFSGADAYHLLDSLISVVENSDQELSLSSADVELIVEDEPMDEEKIDDDDVVIPAPDGGADANDVLFGYSSDDERAKESQVSAEAVAPPSVNEDTPADSSEDSIVPADPDCARLSCSVSEERVPAPPTTRDASVESLIVAANPLPAGSPIAQESKPIGNGPFTPKEVKPHRNNGRRNNHNGVRHENGSRPGGQRRFNNSTNSTPVKSHGHEAGSHARAHDGPANNYKRNAGGNAGYSNTHGRSNGYTHNNTHNKNHGSNNAGYVRHGGYVRPPPGTCGFILKPVDQ